MSTRKNWTIEEVKFIVDDYFSMLLLEINRELLNKSEHRRTLLPLLNNRSEQSIEYKHRNISAALIKMGLPFIKGYLPLFNYQKDLLETEIENYLKVHKGSLEKVFEQFATGKVPRTNQTPLQYDRILEKAPSSSVVSESEPIFRPISTNYLEKEQKNRDLGERGESFVLDYEKHRLISLGKESLADKIEWVSKYMGDGMGYDILSKNKNGTDRFIEVKTTKLTKETPIFFSRNELSFSKIKANDFFLYRVFNFYDSPRLFIKQGDYESFCQIRPQTFKGYF